MIEVKLIHPIDEDLKFFNKYIDDIQKKYPEIVEIVKLEDNEMSHNEALKIIEDSYTNTIIVFLCHGGSNYINGCRYFYSDEKTDIQFDYQILHGHFIDESNLNILINKKVLFVSCHSGLSLVKKVVENGANHCIGFKELIFDDLNKIRNIEDCNENIVRYVEDTFANLLFKSISQLIENNITFTQLTDYLKLLINKECDEIILNSKPEGFYRKANALNDIKDGITLFSHD